MQLKKYEDNFLEKAESPFFFHNIFSAFFELIAKIILIS